MNFKKSLTYNNKFINEYKINSDLNVSNYTSADASDNYDDTKVIDNKCLLIDYIKYKFKVKDLNYNTFTEKIEDLFGSFIYYVSKDEDDKYLLVNKNLINGDNTIEELNNFSTTIYQKNPFKKLVSFMDPITTNNNAIINLKNLENEEFKDLYIKNCIEGINIMLIYDENENYSWKIITEKSLLGTDTNYRNKKIIDLYNDIVKSKNIELDKLNKEKIYNFVLVHNKNNGIVNYNHFGSGYKELYLNMTIEEKENKLIYDFNPNICISKKNIKVANRIRFNNVNDFIENINNISYDNMVNKKITLEGFNIYKVSDNNVVNMKIQTHIYQQILNIKPKHINIHVGYLEMYQENKLKEYLPYLTNYHSEIIHRISMSVRTISKEFLDLYHYLKKNKNSELYNNIPSNYKKVLYKIHGIYIDSRKNDFNNNNSTINTDEIDENKTDTKSITVHDIYHYLKSLPISILKELYFDRENIIKEKKIDKNLYNLLTIDCIYTNIQTKLMMV
jgi:hypothetical protein